MVPGECVNFSAFTDLVEWKCRGSGNPKRGGCNRVGTMLAIISDHDNVKSCLKRSEIYLLVPVAIRLKPVRRGS
jgi:hypothetical protein